VRASTSIDHARSARVRLKAPRLNPLGAERECEAAALLAELFSQRPPQAPPTFLAALCLALPSALSAAPSHPRRMPERRAPPADPSGVGAPTNDVERKFSTIGCACSYEAGDAPARLRASSAPNRAATVRSPSASTTCKCAGGRRPSRVATSRSWMRTPSAAPERCSQSAARTSRPGGQTIRIPAACFCWRTTRRLRRTWRSYPRCRHDVASADSATLAPNLPSPLSSVPVSSDSC